MNRANHVGHIVLSAFPADIRESATVREEPGLVFVDVSPGSRGFSLVPVWVGQGFPRDLEAALRRIDKAGSEGSMGQGSLVYVAREFSAGSQRVLQERRLNWVDEAGNAWLELPGLFITREARPPAPSRVVGPKWSSSAAAVGETILNDFIRARTQDGEPVPVGPVAAVALRAGLSAGRVSEVLKTFDQRGYTRKTGAARGSTAVRLLLDPSGLLSDWASWHRVQTPAEITMHTLWQTPIGFAARDLSRILGTTEWAVSDWLGSELLAPFASEVPVVSVYVDRDLYDTELLAVATEAGMRRVEAGARVRFVRADPVAFQDREVREGVPVVSPVRLYGDLLRIGGRAEDAAEHLRSVVIGW